MPRVGRYEIESEVGRGSMGVVYLAHDPHVRRRVAVKTFMVPGGLSPEQEREYKERFLREAQAAGALSHPAIVTIYDADTDPETGTPYIAMEYVEGQSLRQLLAAKGKMPPDAAFAMVEILAEGLKVAHDAGIVHRDIKPANILVRERDGAVKIADFGVARLAWSDLTGDGDVFGSPAYMSPEQFRGTVVDARSDLFSLATILYQALCGCRPFPGEDLSSLAYSVVHTIPPPASGLTRELPKYLDRFFERALAKDPKERFADGNAFRLALAEVREGRNSLLDPNPPKEKKVVERTPAAAGERSKAGPRWKGISRLEGAFAVGMLLLAVLPGLWILGGGSKKTKDAAANSAEAGASAPDGDGSNVSGGDGAQPALDKRGGSQRRPGTSSAGAGKQGGSTLGKGGASDSTARRGLSGPGTAAANPGPLRSAQGTKGTVRPGGPNEGSAIARSRTGSSKSGTSSAGPSSSTGMPASTLPASSAGSSAAVASNSGAQAEHAILDDIQKLESLPPRSSEASAPVGSYLLVNGRSTVKEGTLTLLVDGVAVYSRHLSTQNPGEGEPAAKLKWFLRKQQSFEARIDLSPGRHEVVAKVLQDGKSEGYQQSTVVEVLPSEPCKLNLVAGRVVGPPLTLKPD